MKREITPDEITNAKAGTLEYLRYLNEKVFALSVLQRFTGKCATMALIPHILKQYTRFKNMRIAPYYSKSKQVYIFIYTGEAFKEYGGHMDLLLCNEEDKRRISPELIKRQLEDVRQEIAEIQGALDFFDEYAARYNNCIKYIDDIRIQLARVLRHGAGLADKANKIHWGF